MTDAWLLVDDTRDLGCGVIARTAEAARTILGSMGHVFAGICLDHDLGTEETGYDVLVWAVERCILPKKVQLVTMNPVGRKRMVVALVAAGYEEDLNGIYVHD
jgi:hypothetical protein